jgi:pimeloyl-ACP methyl ester carboxylesterase
VLIGSGYDMQRWLKRIGIATVALAVLYVVVLGVGGGLALAWSLTPGQVDWSLSHQPSPKDPMELGYRGDPKTALGLDFETIHYQTELGPAEAWLAPAAAPSSTMAIFVHGIGGIRENGYRLLSILHAAGLPTLMITYRNDDNAPASKPAFRTFGLTEWRDLDAAAGWALGHGASHLVIVGESMGGAVAGQFLAHSTHAGAVSALVLDAPAVDFEVVADWALAQYHVPLGDQLASIATSVASHWSPVPLSDANVFDAVAGFPGPVFIAHGSTDQLVPFTLSQKLVAARQGPTVFFQTSADHLHSYKEQPEKYRQELGDFLAALPKG